MHSKQEIRSVLAQAGSRSISSETISYNNYKVTPKKQINYEMETKKIMMKLTLPRLRKMQALVRGFLTRRKIYPILLQEYVLAKSIMNVVIDNVLYRESSEVVMEQLTYLKYEPDSEQTMQGVQTRIQNEICNDIIGRVVNKQLTNVIEGAVAEHAQLITRPKITYGFNLRDPLQLLLYDSVNRILSGKVEQAVSESINECAREKRQQLILMEWIDKYGLLMGIYEEIVEQSLRESIGQYIVENMLNRMTGQASQVVSQLTYSEQMREREQETHKQIQNKLIQLMLQQSVCNAILQVKHSITQL